MKPSRYLKLKICRALGVKYDPRNVVLNQQIEYLYFYIVGKFELVEHRDIINKINELKKDYKPRTNRLHILYIDIKLKNMNESGRYDTSSKLPVYGYTYDKGTKLC